MERKKMFVVIGLLLLLIGGITTIGYVMNGRRGPVPFYVGVTYCGSSVQEAKELVDTVKSYTNFFVLQSGVLQYDVGAMEVIGDYVVASNLSYAVYGGTRNTVVSNEWLNGAKERWGEQFIGVYYNDEVGGYMLDKTVFLETTYLEDLSTLMPRVEKTERGAIILYNYEDNHDNITVASRITYCPDGEIIMEKFNEVITYYPNGSITVFESEQGNSYVTGNITKYSAPIQSYDQVLKQNPIQSYDDAAIAYVNMNKGLLEEVNNVQLNKESNLVFTADYGLYWWNYQSGYTLVLAELAWNNTVTQEIALARGAANLQGKSWGTCITWKYTHSPYLTDGVEMFEQMKVSYEAGAEYVLVFNYSEDPANPNILQEEHFISLERFWNEVVQNPEIAHGGVKAEAVLVLPKNYGWGLRLSGDRIWGIWPADDKAQEIWNQIQNKISQHGLKLDIIFEDSNYPVTGKYSNIYYWNQK